MKSQKDKIFTDEERRSIFQEYLSFGSGRWKRRVSEKYGISGHCTFHKWIKAYVMNGEIVPETPEEAFERQMSKERKKLNRKKSPSQRKYFHRKVKWRRIKKSCVYAQNLKEREL